MQRRRTRRCPPSPASRRRSRPPAYDARSDPGRDSAPPPTKSSGSVRSPRKSCQYGPRWAGKCWVPASDISDGSSVQTQTYRMHAHRPMESTVLLHLRLRLAQTLDARAALLAFQPPRPRGGGRARRPPRLRRHGGAANEIDQACERVVAVALLGAVALRRDDEHAIVGEPAAGQPFEPRAHRIGQRWRVAHVEAQLHGGRHLVDVLPARTRGADETLLDPALVDGDRIGDADHLLVIPGRPRSGAPGIHNHRRCDNGKTRGYGFRPWRFAFGRNDRLNDFSVNLPPVSAGRPREGGDPMTTTLAETQWRWSWIPARGTFGAAAGTTMGAQPP